jgi:hypothetical protein
MGNFCENGGETWRSLARYFLIICASMKESIFWLSVLSVSYTAGN